MTGDQAEHGVPPSEAATRSAAAAVRKLGIDPGAILLVRSGTRAVYQLGDDGGVLARVTTARHRDDAQYELAVARWLGDAGIPADQPWPGSGLYEEPGLVVTLWRFRAGPFATTTELGNVLRRLHSLSSADAPTLRKWTPFAEMRLRLDAARGLSPSEVARLRALVDETEVGVGGLDFALPQGLIHGDASVGNLMHAADESGGLVLYDLDGVCTGPREWDLVITSVYQELGWHTPAEYADFVAAYGFDVRTWSGYSVLARAQRLRMICWLAQRAHGDEAAERELRARIADLDGSGSRYAWQAL